MEHDPIRIKYQVPSLTGEMIHSVSIADRSLFDSWEPANLERDSSRFTHDLNAWASSMGDVHLLRVAIYPFVTDNDGQINTDCGHPIACNVLDCNGDPNLIETCVGGEKCFGYVKKDIPEMREKWSKLDRMFRWHW